MSLKRNALWNLAGDALPTLAGVALIPYTLNRLSSEAFGVLTLICGLIGYFSLYDFSCVLRGAAVDGGSKPSRPLAQDSPCAAGRRTYGFFVAAADVVPTTLASGLRGVLERVRSVCSVRSEPLYAGAAGHSGASLCLCVVVLKTGTAVRTCCPG